jgi:hypothetical protein
MFWAAVYSDRMRCRGCFCFIDAVLPFFYPYYTARRKFCANILHAPLLPVGKGTNGHRVHL